MHPRLFLLAGRIGRPVPYERSKGSGKEHERHEFHAHAVPRHHEEHHCEAGLCSKHEPEELLPGIANSVPEPANQPDYKSRKRCTPYREHTGHRVGEIRHQEEEQLPHHQTRLLRGICSDEPQCFVAKEAINSENISRSAFHHASHCLGAWNRRTARGTFGQCVFGGIMLPRGSSGACVVPSPKVVSAGRAQHYLPKNRVVARDPREERGDEGSQEHGKDSQPVPPANASALRAGRTVVAKQNKTERNEKRTRFEAEKPESPEQKTAKECPSAQRDRIGKDEDACEKQ